MSKMVSIATITPFTGRAPLLADFRMLPWELQPFSYSTTYNMSYRYEENAVLQGVIDDHSATATNITHRVWGLRANYSGLPFTPETVSFGVFGNLEISHHWMLDLSPDYLGKYYAGFAVEYSLQAGTINAQTISLLV